MNKRLKTSLYLYWMFSKWHKFRIFWKKSHFLPFGHGPRSCIGMRFAKLEAKIALANMVKNFELLPSKRTYSGASFIYPKNGHFIKAEKHENIGRYWNSLSFFIGYSKAYHYLLHIYMKVLWSKFFTTNSSSCSYLLRIYSNQPSNPGNLHILISWNK